MFRFFFDVDGVLLDFEGTYIPYIKNYFQLKIPDDYQPNCWFFSDLLTHEQLMEGWDAFIESEEFGQLAPLVEPELFNSVFGAYPVHFITNIPPDYIGKRKQNLHSAGFQWDSLHSGGFVSFDDNPPVLKADIIQQLAKDGEILVFIDDHPDNCVNVFEHFSHAHVWLKSRPFNLEFTHPTIRRVDTWDEIMKFSHELINESVPN